ncbi:PTS sugar transporter [Lactobacillus paracasei subsp. paracasei]|uniref:PTS transporter subunit EIIC n=1 Tax=Lacticaseibacillus paracasei TaxID=1597 RepID=UPI0018C47C69|nr:PTS transporter subunit EIIC [Lacticaseibacillus paracasei]MBG1272264.1 PTS sugar transporter [Lacticaseibacillus paracasei subsp. paracasei]
MEKKLDSNELAKNIIEKVGGTSNVASVNHCFTRLRFQLKNVSLAKTDELKSLNGVLTVMISGGQYQVVLGNNVTDVYNAIGRKYHFGNDTNQSEKSSKSDQGIISKLINIISSIFQPILPVLAAAGILKGFLALFVYLHWISSTGETYVVLNAIGDAFFYFLPVLLGCTAAEKFGSNKYTGMTIGAALCYPTITKLASGKALGTLFTGSSFSISYFGHFLGLPLMLPTNGYPSSVIPIILAVWFASVLEKKLRRIIPDSIKFFTVPALVLLITISLVFIVIGPIAVVLSKAVANLFLMIYKIPVFGGLVSGLILGALWQILVIFGLHWGLIPLAFVDYSTLGFDKILSPFFPASFAQIMVVLAILLKTKDSNLKHIALPAFVTGIFGITEPCIYGVTLPKKKPFVISCIGASVGGAIVGFFGVKSFLWAGGIEGFPAYIDTKTNDATGMFVQIAAVIVASVISFVLTMLTYHDNKNPEQA